MIPARFSETVREWLGWCPGAGTARFGRPGAPGPVVPAQNTAGSVSDGSGSIAGGGSPTGRVYEHTQAGMIQILAVITIMVVIVATTLLFGALLIPLAVMMLLVVAVLCFATLTVTLENDAVRIRFGPLGLIRREWPVRDIVSVTGVTNPWYYGYGLRWTPHGPLYNVAGPYAVEILLRSGDRVRIGTDEPEALVKVIANASP